MTRFLVLLTCVAKSFAGSIFLTGHDPDFHASLGGNLTGARNINITAISFILDPAFNSFVSTAPKFLFVESAIGVPGGHTRGVNGIIASGYTSGVDFDWVTATTLNAALDGLGSSYSGIVIASDFGGTLTQAELDILDARSTNIIAFLNAGGGLYAMAESNNGAHLTPNGGRFGYLPFVVTAPSLDQSESGFTATPFGMSLGLTSADVNGNASHNVFAGPFGLQVVDRDGSGNIMSLAGRGNVTKGGVDEVPEPASIVLIASGIAVLARRRIITTS